MKHEDRIQESADRIQKKMKKGRIQEREYRIEEIGDRRITRIKAKGERSNDATNPTNAARDGLYDTRTLRLNDATTQAQTGEKIENVRAGRRNR
jgi:hypothetical protein